LHGPDRTVRRNAAAAAVTRRPRTPRNARAQDPLMLRARARRSAASISGLPTTLQRPPGRAARARTAMRAASCSSSCSAVSGKASTAFAFLHKSSESTDHCATRVRGGRGSHRLWMAHSRFPLRMPSGPRDAARMAAVAASGAQPGLVAFYIRDGFCLPVVGPTRDAGSLPEGATHVILVEIRQHVGAQPSSTRLQRFAEDCGDLRVIDLVVADPSGRWAQLPRLTSTTPAASSPCRDGDLAATVTRPR
jgi:hypothetical protein